MKISKEMQGFLLEVAKEALSWPEVASVQIGQRKVVEFDEVLIRLRLQNDGQVFRVFTERELTYTQHPRFAEHAAAELKQYMNNFLEREARDNAKAIGDNSQRSDNSLPARPARG